VLTNVISSQIHPYMTQQPLQDLAKTLGVALTSYSTFGPLSFVELGNDGGVKSLFEQSVVLEAAKAHGKSAYLDPWERSIAELDKICSSRSGCPALGAATWHSRYSQGRPGFAIILGHTGLSRKRFPEQQPETPGGEPSQLRF
jgi:hypothetical protein